MLNDVPAEYAEAAKEERDALWRLADQARTQASAGDLDGMRELAEVIHRRMEDGNAVGRTGGHLRSHIDDILTALDQVYDEAFPVADPSDPADVLDTPWPTNCRGAILASMGYASHWYNRGFAGTTLNSLAHQAIAAADVPLLRQVVGTRLRGVNGETVVRALDTLHAVGALETKTIERAFSNNPHLGTIIAGNSSERSAYAGKPAACESAARDCFDELTWYLTSLPEPVGWDRLPKGWAPRGLRFVRRALQWQGDAKVAAHLGAAELTDAERTGLVEYLRDRPAAEQRRAFELRLPAGDAELLLPLLGLHRAERLLRLVQGVEEAEVVRRDRVAIVAAVEEAAAGSARTLLELCPSELVSAAMGWNRAAVHKRVKHNALHGIAAFGMLPLDDGETALDRYLALRDVAKRGAKLGPNRRHSHTAAVAVSLEHLAQVAGFPDGSRLEWDCEARIAAEVPGEWSLGDYTAAVRLHGGDPVIAVSKAGKALKSVPAAVRAHPQYAEIRQHQQRLRDQASRMRTGLIERLVATGGTLAPDELSRLRSLPSGAAMLPALLWQDRSGTIGLLDEIDADSAVTAVHPFLLYERGVLADWQAEIVQRRIRQPVKQAFRELYVLTPAEREAVDVSQRFAGHAVEGRIAGQLLSGRGWSTHHEYAEHQATRPVGGGLTAALRCDLPGYFGGGTAVVGEVRFLASGAAVPLADVPPAAFSEVMRDLDLVVSVAGTDPQEYGSPPAAASRAQLLTALIDDLGLARVSVEGTSALVRGSRATYRVHLTSGSIHVEPGGYLCVVPASFGRTSHRRLFLPFDDEDRMTSVVLSKVLLLAEDEKITDPTILAQLDRLA